MVAQIFGIIAAETEQQDLHAGKACCLKQCPDGIVQNTKIFGNQGFE